jgi:hypothetical protein
MLFLIVVLSCAACGTLPDLEPFASATAELQKAVSTSHDSVYNELSVLASQYPDDEEFKSFPKQFSDAWGPRITAMEALVHYSDSLAAIASAAKEGRKDAEALAGSLESLVASVGGPMGAVSSSVGGRIAVSLYGAIQEIRASKALDKAVIAADPLVQEVSTLILQDFITLEQLLDPPRLEASMEAAIKRTYTNDYNADPAYRKQLMGKQKEAIGAVEQERGKTPIDASALKVAIDRLSELNTQLAATNDWNDKLNRDLAAMRNRFAAQRIIIAKTKKGIQEWQKIHHSLALALQRNKERPNFRILLNTALEIQSLLKEGKQL